MSDYEAFQQRVLSGAFHVWTNDMLASFNRAASESSILLFGRVETMSSPFVQLGPDLWPHIEVQDWDHGTAKLPDGTEIWSIHASMAAPLKSKAGRRPFYDQDQINGEVVRILKAKGGRPAASGDANWQANADLERMVAAFCRRVMLREPSKSTVQKLVKKALDYSTARGL